MFSLRTCSALCKNVFSFQAVSGKSVLQKVRLGVRCLHDVEINEVVEDKYRKEDGLGPDMRIVYRSPLQNYVKSGHYISFGCGVSTPVTFMTFFLSGGNLLFPVTLGTMPFFRDLYDYLMFQAILFSLIAQVYALVLTYPLRIYSNNKGDYVAVFSGIYPWKTVKKDFKAGQLKKLESSMPWGDNLYQIKTKKALLLEDYFIRPIDLQKMLGKQTTYND